VTKNGENFSFLDTHGQIVNSGKLSKLFGQILDQDWVIFIINLWIKVFVEWLSLLWNIVIFQEVKPVLLNSISVWHDIIEVKVNNEPEWDI
jgi:hypothetical protein